MHNVCFMITKAINRDDATESVLSYLNTNEYRFYDWYAIGGRWFNTLAPMDKVRNFEEIVERYKKEYKQNKEIPRELLQKAWEECDLKGNNIHSNHYNLPVEGDYYDTMPLSECIEKLLEKHITAGKRQNIMYIGNIIEELAILHEEYIKEEDETKQEYILNNIAYKASRLKALGYQELDYDTTVYNIVTESFHIPEENIEDYYVVVVDFHS